MTKHQKVTSNDILSQLFTSLNNFYFYGTFVYNSNDGVMSRHNKS